MVKREPTPFPKTSRQKAQWADGIGTPMEKSRLHSEGWFAQTKGFGASLCREVVG